MNTTIRTRPKFEIKNIPVVDNKAKLSLLFWFKNETDRSMTCALREDFNIGKCQKFKLKKTGSDVSLPGVRNPTILQKN
jgi:hypothetical protein